MDAPPIQYCKTSDGVNIAYWTMGEGRRLLVAPPLQFSHLTLEWLYPPLRAWYEQLTRYRTVIRWDPRYHGLSDRGAPGPVIGAIQDVQAVLDRVSGEPCDILLASGVTGNGAIEYAAAQPVQVRNLVIFGPLLRGELFGQGQLGLINALAEQDETLWSENAARWSLGWESGRQAHAYAAFIRACVNHEDAKRVSREIPDYDSMSVLPHLTTRVLVIGNLLTEWDMQHSREVTAAIPGAVLVETADRGLLVNSGESRAVNEFLGLPIAFDEGTTETSGTAIILFLDIAGSTELTTKLGDAAFREKERELDAALREAIRQAGGSPVEGKVLGDGVMATFASAKDAIDAALACRLLGDGAVLPLHAGIHAGDVMREGNNVHGGAVQVAARIADASAPGEVLVSQTVRDLARTSAGVSFEDRGERELKGVSEAVRVFAVVRA